MLHRIILIFILSFILETPIFCQNRTVSAGISTDQVSQSDAKATTEALKSLDAKSFPADNVINPERYFVGPGDVLALQIVGAISGEFPLIISPENSIMVPRIGSIDVRNKTLAQVKLEVQKQITQRNPNNIGYLTLQKARTVFVAIKGNVLNPGLYTLPASMKISTAVALANQQSATQQLQNTQQKPLPFFKANDPKMLTSQAQYQFYGSYSLRNTIVQHRDGMVEMCDAVLAIALGESANEPTIREGDEISVPFENILHSTISISGAVRKPSVVSFRHGDKASMLWKLGCGANENANMNQVYLTIPNSNVHKTLSVENGVLVDDFEMASGSSIIVGEEESVSEHVASIIISGKVASPGSFLIEEGKTRLKDVVSQAGGFTADASVALSYIFRKEIVSPSLDDAENDVARNFQLSDLRLYDTARYRLDMVSRRPNVSCNFNAAFNQNSVADNVLLHNGDLIIVPPDPKTVYIFGQVGKPGYVEFSAGQTMDWYIRQAGGFAGNAEAKRARIIKGNTRAWIEGDDHAIVDSGDMVYVPREIETPANEKLQEYAVIAGFLSAFTALVSVMYLIFKK